MSGARLEMSIWKQCNLAVSGSGERTNVCLMWARPGHVIAVFTREKQRGGYKKNVIKHSGLWFNAGCFLPMCLQLSFFVVVHFPLLMSISRSLSLSYVHTQNPTPILISVCAAVSG